MDTVANEASSGEDYSSSEELDFVVEDADVVSRRSKYIPLRLSDHERDLLTILSGALEISEYTDHVDVSSHMYGSFWSNGSPHNKTSVMKRELREMLGFVSGLYVASDYKAGKWVEEAEKKEAFFQNIFEIGRRYKIMNPEKMRTTYGKLMYLMQDAVMPGLLDLNVKIDIKTVHGFLKSKNCLKLLNDKALGSATRCLVGATLEQQKEEAVLRRKAREHLVKKYTSESCTKEDVLLCLDSLSDSNSFILANRHPVDMMIRYLEKYFDPNREEQPFSLAIRSGKDGSELSHNHPTQYTFVSQSLHLWREIQHEMFKLWTMANEDLLQADSYRLVDTGQGLQRMLSCPNVGGAMSSILSTVRKASSAGWVGLSVVHLGDRDVPNALIFIDKYTQVPRILAPIVNTIERLHEYVEDPALNAFVQHFGGLEHVVKMILSDFFKHGFDGSGDDGGSCIDGRLTSAWNWCSKIEKKVYYPIFMLTGFFGFDGSFKK